MTTALVQSPLRHLDITTVSEAARAESRRRETHLPPVSAFRWWARRTESVVGALIEAFNIDHPGRLSIADPFAGGGTIAFAGAMRGHQVYAQEINPWAATGLAVAMSLPTSERIRTAKEELEQRARDLLRDAYEVDGRVMLRTLRVVRGQCPTCQRDNYLYPTGLVSLIHRVDAGGSIGWVACPAGHLSQGPTSRRHRCGTCRRLIDPTERRTKGKAIKCWNCRRTVPIRELISREWEVVLIESTTADGREIRLPTQKEKALADSSRWQPKLRLGPIPKGDETAQLIRAGFNTWDDLYPRRQAFVIESLLSVAHDIGQDDEQIHRLLELAILGTVEFAGYASRWDSRYLKPYETIANHRYEAPTLSAEPHVWGHNGFGRGTVESRLRALGKAATWRQERLGRRTVSIRTTRRRVRPTADTTIVSGSSERIGVPDGTFDLVLTDPPYHDDVQYGELSWLFRAWRGDTSMLPGDVTVGSAGCRANDYRALLSSVFREIRRTLKPEGHLILSYANREPEAWIDLAAALEDAGFSAVGYTFTQSENETDHAKRNKRATTIDLLLDLVPSGPKLEKYAPSFQAQTAQEQFVVTAGSWLLRIGELPAGWEEQMRSELSQSPFIKPVHRISAGVRVGRRFQLGLPA